MSNKELASEFLEEGKDEVYEGYRIYHNFYNEYCVSFQDGEMVKYNSSFATVGKAKEYIDDILAETKTVNGKKL